MRSKTSFIRASPSYSSCKGSSPTTGHFIPWPASPGRSVRPSPLAAITNETPNVYPQSDGNGSGQAL